jgi:hypothetical protein
LVFVINGNKSWTDASDGVSFELEAEEVAQFKKSLCQLPEPDDLKPKVLLPGFRTAQGGTLDGQPVVIVEGKNKAGFAYKVFFDAKTNLPNRREYEAETMPDRKKETRTAVVEYKEMAGLKYAYRTVETVEGKLVHRTEVELKFVEKFDEATFQEPVAASVRDPMPIFRVFTPGAPGAPPDFRGDPKYWPPQWRP